LKILSDQPICASAYESWAVKTLRTRLLVGTGSQGAKLLDQLEKKTKWQDQSSFKLTPQILWNFPEEFGSAPDEFKGSTQKVREPRLPHFTLRVFFGYTHNFVR